jgi:hypothetical protein
VISPTYIRTIDGRDDEGVDAPAEEEVSND